MEVKDIVFLYFYITRFPVFLEFFVNITKIKLSVSGSVAHCSYKWCIRAHLKKLLFSQHTIPLLPVLLIFFFCLSLSSQPCCFTLFLKLDSFCFLTLQYFPSHSPSGISAGIAHFFALLHGRSVGGESWSDGGGRSVVSGAHKRSR